MTIKFHVIGELQERLNQIFDEESWDSFFDTPIKWKCPFLPETGDDIHWITFFNTDKFPISEYNLVENLSFESYVSSKFWGLNKSGVYCTIILNKN
jgi:hypothetical protein